jgi:hypothetical protein
VVLAASLVTIAVLGLRWATTVPEPAPDVGAVPASRRSPDRPSTDTPATSPPAPRPAGPDALGSRPARLADLGVRRPVVPVRVRIGPDLDGPVIPVGVDPSGAMAVPPDPAVVTWYEHGPAPGEAGSAVLAGHVDYGGRQGVFFHLADVAPGTGVVVTGADGSERHFTVVARRHYPKSDLPATALFDRQGPPRLVLVTCGGEFDDQARSYRENIVVYAEPAR